MRRQPRYQPYRASALLAAGTSMQAPPPFTVPRDGMDSSTATASPDRGKDRFDIFCAVCHGERADGVSIVASNMDDPTPPSLLAAPIRSLSDAQLDSIMIRGFGRMPPMAAELSRTDQRAVVAYLRDVQRRSPVTALRLPDSLRTHTR